MNRTGSEIPKLDMLDFDALVQHRAIDDATTESDVLKFISTRMSLQAGLELLGVPLIGGSRMKIERDRAEHILQAFENYLIDKGCNIPELMWEPIGLTIFDPVLNAEAHKIS